MATTSFSFPFSVNVFTSPSFLKAISPDKEFRLIFTFFLYLFLKDFKAVAPLSVASKGKAGTLVLTIPPSIEYVVSL